MEKGHKETALLDSDFLDHLRITGTQVAYYVVCRRKLWLFTRHISFEDTSDYVAIGKLISETSFKRERLKEVEVGDSLKIDFLKVGSEIIVHEVKKSRKLEDAHIWQVKFYIYSLRKLGVNVQRGVIHYPKLMRKVDVEFEKNDESKIEEILKEIVDVRTHLDPPPVIKKGYCKKCAYYDFCFV